MLMFVREQYITLTGDSGSMDLQGFRNPIPHIYGVTTGSKQSTFAVKSYLRDIPTCSPTNIHIGIDHKLLTRLSYLTY